MIAFVAIFMTVLTEARLGGEARKSYLYYKSFNRSMGLRNYRDEMDNDDEEFVGRPAHTRGNGRTYRSNGYTMNSRGYLANPSRSAQIRARNAGALTIPKHV